MRKNFQRDLSWLESRTEEALGLARDALELTVQAIIDRDPTLADEVIAGDDKLDELYQTIHNEMLGIIARQAPVASDLRLLTGLGFMAMHIERMGDACVNVAQLLKLAGPGIYPLDISMRVASMGQMLLTMIDQTTQAFLLKDLYLAHDLVRLDDGVDDANLRVFQEAVGPTVPPEARAWAGYMMLTARAFERLGDHIVDLGEQIAFIVTGEFREFADTPPEPAPVAQ